MIFCLSSGRGLRGVALGTGVQTCALPFCAPQPDPPPAVQAKTSHPNIVILVADDWGFSDVGSFGAGYATPNIDALAHAGVRFSNFHVSGSCSPTRAMLQTGVMNHRKGLGHMPETIPPEHVGKPRSEERSVGKAWVRTCRSRWAPD